MRLLVTGGAGFIGSTARGDRHAPGPAARPSEPAGDPGVPLLQGRRPVLHLGHQTITAHMNKLLLGLIGSWQRHTFKCRCSIRPFALKELRIAGLERQVVTVHIPLSRRSW
jgi:hypothetical protein